MLSSERQGGFSLLEVAVSLGIVALLLAILIPALSTARSAGQLERCAVHQQQLSEIWNLYLGDHDGQFPSVAVQPGWHYGGARFSTVNGEPFVDPQRPLNAYLGAQPGNAAVLEMFRCPGDCGITHRDTPVGTGRRTAYRSFGTSFRANAAILKSTVDEEPRGLRRREIGAAPSRLVLMGDPVWYETFFDTGRRADWHGSAGGGNILFLDGSVRFETVLPKTSNQPVVLDPGIGDSGTEREEGTEGLGLERTALEADGLRR